MRAAAAPWVVAGLLCLVPQAQARVLLEDQGVQVTTAETLQCGAPVAVDVTSDHPDLFAASSPAMQALLDATRAVLGFECRGVPEIRLTGRLRGISQPSYEASASAASGWRLAVTRSLRAAPGAAPAPATSSWAPPAAPAAPAAAAPAASRFAIRDLTTGMSVDAAMERARRSFDAAPAYDARRRELSVVKGGCEVNEGARPKPGWVCMKTLFTDGGDPRAYRLSYVQTVDKGQAAAIAGQLRERFGAADVDEEQRTAAWLRGGEPERHLAWGAPVSVTAGEPRRELEARIRVEGETAILSLDLVDAALAGQAPRYPVRF